jgi:hypothetical protein
MRIRGINIPVQQNVFSILFGQHSMLVTGGPGGGPRAGHQHGADQDNFQFCEIYSYKKEKKVRTTNFSSFLCFAVVGSEI